MQAESIISIEDIYNSSMKTGRPAKSERTDFGSRVQQLREEAKLSQREVAAELGISQPAYALWERRNVAIPAEQIKKLADVFGVTVDTLFNSADEHKRRGPTGKARKIFEEISTYSRRDQKELLELIEFMMRPYRNKQEEKKAS